VEKPITSHLGVFGESIIETEGCIRVFVTGKLLNMPNSLTGYISVVCEWI